MYYPVTRRMMLYTKPRISCEQKIGILDTRLAKIADLLFKQIIDPIVRDPGFVVEFKELDQPERAVISWISSTSKVIFVCCSCMLYLKVLRY